VLLTADWKSAAAEAFRRGAILTKHVAWAFEQEFRIAKDVRGALPADSSGVDNMFRLPEDAVAEIILGPRMGAVCVEAIERLLSSGRYAGAHLRRLTISRTTYNLEIG
jgi:hypothetical protein